MIARKVLRNVYCTADIGISGANFAIAETGMISISENEGNARLTTSLPKIHVAIMGIEKVLPKLSDLALFLPLLGTAGAGRRSRVITRCSPDRANPARWMDRTNFILSYWITTARNSSPIPSNATRSIASAAARA